MIHLGTFRPDRVKARGDPYITRLTVPTASEFTDMTCPGTTLTVQVNINHTAILIGFGPKT